MSELAEKGGTASRPKVGVAVVARTFGVSRPTVRRMAHAGLVPSFKLGAVLRFDLEEVESALRTAPVQKPQPTLNLAAA